MHFPGLTPQAAIEIAVIFAVVYTFLRFIRGTRGALIFKGVLVSLLFIGPCLYLLAGAFELDVIKWIISGAIPFFIGVLVIVLQPEIRRALFRLWKDIETNFDRYPLIRLFVRRRRQETSEILRAVEFLSQKRVGALIAIGEEGLNPVIESGVPVDAAISRELLATLFWPGSPLHDKGVVVHQGRIAAASCLFPLTEDAELRSRLGTRHQAAIGLSEETDALVIVVSEESGRVSLAARGALRENLAVEELEAVLRERLQPKPPGEAAAVEAAPNGQKM